MQDTIRADITPICRAMIEHFARVQALIMQLEDRYHIDGSAVEDAVAVHAWVDANGLAHEHRTTELVADVLALITARVAPDDQPAPQGDSSGRRSVAYGTPAPGRPATACAMLATPRGPHAARCSAAATTHQPGTRTAERPLGCRPGWRSRGAFPRRAPRSRSCHAVTLDCHQRRTVPVSHARPDAPAPRWMRPHSA